MADPLLLLPPSIGWPTWAVSSSPPPSADPGGAPPPTPPESAIDTPLCDQRWTAAGAGAAAYGPAAAPGAHRRWLPLLRGEAADEAEGDAYWAGVDAINAASRGGGGGRGGWDDPQSRRESE